MASLAGLDLLIVEDDEDTRDLMEFFLHGEGARVRVASSAGEARAAIGEKTPDVILTDITLPDEDGFVFIGRLRADPATQHIPAIAITGHTDAQSRSSALGAGFQKFVTKPFDIFSLSAAIASLAPVSKGPAAEMDEARISRCCSSSER